MKTSIHLKTHNLTLPLFGKNDFKEFKTVTICDLHANQENLDVDCLNLKIKGKNLSIPYVVKFFDKLILIDGHHTVVSKKINGQKKVKVLFLKLETVDTITKINQVMKTQYTGKKCQHVDYFNQNNHPNISLHDFGEIKKFLINEGYIIQGWSATHIILNKGSINGAKSFIDYKSPLFKNVKFEYDSDGIVYITKTN